MGLSKLGPWKVAGPPFRRDAASVTSESCAWRDIFGLRHVYGACLSSQDIMANLTVIHFPNGIQQNGAYFH
ncbi:hypothetical protein YC2023_042057 [Brassica napus]